MSSTLNLFYSFGFCHGQFGVSPVYTTLLLEQILLLSVEFKEIILHFFHLLFLSLLSDAVPPPPVPRPPFRPPCSSLPFPACLAGPEAPAAPCPVQPPAVPA